MGRPRIVGDVAPAIAALDFCIKCVFQDSRRTYHAVLPNGELATVTFH